MTSESEQRAAEVLLTEGMDGDFLVGAGLSIGNTDEDVPLQDARPNEIAHWAARTLAAAGLLAEPPSEHRLLSPPHPWQCACGWKPVLGESVWRAFDKHLAGVAARTHATEAPLRAAVALLADWDEYEWQSPSRDQYEKGYARGYENALRSAGSALRALLATAHTEDQQEASDG